MKYDTYTKRPSLMTTIRKRVNIKQVAQEAGVSIQTVSRVLNDRPDVAASTRQRVLEVINRLDYRPSALARSLIRQRSHTLGVVTTGLVYLGPSQTLKGIVQQAEMMGYAILLKELPQFEANNVEPILNSLLARHVDGLIWAVPEVGHNRTWLHDHLPDLAVPIVFLTMHPHPGLTIVSVDNFLGGCLATHHLLQQGYRHIAHLSGPLTWWEAQQRKAGWETALAEAGLPAGDHQWVEGNWSPESGYQAMQQLFEQYPALEAVFVANDQMALGVLQLARRKGWRVPQDLAVVGFDNMPESAFFCPPLTTIQQDLYDLGHTAVKQVVTMIEAGRRPELIWLKPELIIRESSVAG